MQHSIENTKIEKGEGKREVQRGRFQYISIFNIQFNGQYNEKPYTCN